MAASAVRLVDEPPPSSQRAGPTMTMGAGWVRWKYGAGSRSVRLLQGGLSRPGAPQRDALVEEEVATGVLIVKVPAESWTTCPVGQASMAAWMPSVASLAPLP